jgi:uncharacterized protein YbjQ (UPF0145 family)
MRHISLIALTALMVAAPAMARDTALHLDNKDVLAASYSQGKLDGSVQFYFADQSTPTVIGRLGDATTSRKTSGVGKSDADACRWAMLSALLALQAQAKSLGANAVVGITSNYNQQAYSSTTQFECHAGGIMVGVALKGTYAKVSDH